MNFRRRFLRRTTNDPPSDVTPPTSIAVAKSTEIRNRVLRSSSLKSGEKSSATLVASKFPTYIDCVFRFGRIPTEAASRSSSLKSGRNLLFGDRFGRISIAVINSISVCKQPFSFSPVYAENGPAKLPFQEFVVGMSMKACHILQFFLRLTFVLSVPKHDRGDVCRLSVSLFTKATTTLLIACSVCALKLKRKFNCNPKFCEQKGPF